MIKKILPLLIAGLAVGLLAALRLTLQEEVRHWIFSIL